MADNIENKKCDYGWQEDSSFDGTVLPKKSVDGRDLVCGQYVRNNIVSGKIVFYSTSCEFRVKVLGCRYKKETSSIEFFYPTPLGRETETNWQVFDNSEELQSWLSYFQPYKNPKSKGE